MVGILNSSLKYFNFEGYSQDDIIAKFDSVLLKRESQIQELSTDLSLINDKVSSLYSANQALERKNNELANKVIKLERRVEDEQTSKFVLFKKYESLDNELTHLKKSGMFSNLNSKSGNSSTNQNKNVKQSLINEKDISSQEVNFSQDVHVSSSKATLPEKLGNAFNSLDIATNLIDNNSKVRPDIAESEIKKQPGNTSEYVLASDMYEYDYMS